GSKEPTEPTTILSEARAKIIWGEPLSSVRDYLVSHGLSSPEADEKIKEFNAERNAAIRKVGLKSTIVGAALVLVAGWICYVCCTNPKFDWNRYAIRNIATIVLVGLYGCWKLFNGIVYLVRPQSEDKSITEIPD
ncbi:MAG: hypothetical protein ABSF34_04320, partial [Verrucomicrobiota bacterium]